MNISKIKILAVSLGVSAGMISGLILPLASYGATATSAASGVRGEKMEARIAERIPLIKSRADQEINRRINALNRLSDRVGKRKRVSDSEKNNIAAEVAGEITNLTNLKAKIDGDADIATLREDVKSILGSYRIFALVIPQGEILVGADRIKTIADNMITIGTKLQTRIADAKAAGKDTSSLDANLADYNAKIADSKTQAQSAIDVVSGLAPDNGDQVKAAANRSALQKGRGFIFAGMKDLKAAREDARKIVQVLKAMGAASNASASSTVPSRGRLSE